MRLWAIVILSLGLAACSSFGDTLRAPLRWVGLGGEPAPAVIDAERFLAHVEVLASDEFEGRLPGTRGEDLTVDYLIKAFRASGAKPGHPRGGYTQDVPLAGLVSQADVGFEANGEPVPVRMQRDVVAVSQRLDPVTRVRRSPLVFVGYGVQAPEYDWDDYKGLDVRGKTLLMLVNDPPVPDPVDPSRLDPDMFKGRAMTYYGRWTYKYEIASKLGADAVLVIHETEEAGYPWEVVSGSWGTENFTLDAADGNRNRVPVEGWITDAKAGELLAAAGQNFAALKRAARSPGFRPVELPARASFQVRNKVRKVASRNVIAKIPGTERPDEYVLYTAHWDHLGRNPDLEGDQIYNGAVDNATGTAALLELAKVFAADPPRRSVLFLALTAEEQGLLGARHYAGNPLYPLDRTLAVLNIDGLNVWGPTRDVTIVGEGQSTLEDRVADAAATQGRVMRPETSPEKGYYFRSDHFEFAKRGVPALFARAGNEYIGQDAGFGERMRAHYTANHYHKVSDEVRPDWNLAGAVLDIELLEIVGRAVANADGRPQWKAGSEFADAGQQRHP